MSQKGRFERVEELFHAVLEIEPEKRSAFLADECGGDASLLSEVEALLSADSVGTIDIGGGLASASGAESYTLAAGAEIGPYRILEPLGEGGMGEVYRAEQTGPLQREVALKVIKAGLDTRQVLRRFENERQTLALMNHPGLARVFDAGATDGGRPYFAMELVPGQAITQFCDDRRLSLDDRLELFTHVCRAVQHAHQKGVIHRDLKPSNILVEERAGQPRPKIIDFGIAKATTPGASASTLATRVGQVVGTPEYMSPEQADLGADVDTRSDVYSLGVLLYELLTGSHPFDVGRLRRSSLEEVSRYLHDVEPERPSRIVARGGDEIDSSASARGMDRASMRRALEGDLDWIVTKALEKEPDRRYGSAAELAADVVRFQQHQPVEAGPPGRAYRARKFVQRHRLPVAAAVTLAAVLLAAIVGVSIALVRARHAEADAVRQATVAEEVTEFLGSLFEGEDPYGPALETRSLEGIVAGAAERLRGGAVQDPEVFGRLALSLGSVMLRQGLHEEGSQILQEGIDRLRATEEGQSGVLFLDLLYQRSRADVQMGRFDEARETARELVSLAPSILPPGSPNWGLYLMQRGTAERTAGKVNAQESWYRQALAALRAASDVRPEDLALVLSALADATADSQECSRLTEEQLQIWTESLGVEHPRVAEAWAILATCARLRGDAGEAAGHLQEVARLRETTLGPEHPRTLWNGAMRAETLYTLGRFGDARELVDSALDAARTTADEYSIALLLNQTFAYLPGDAEFGAASQREDESLRLYLKLFEGESAWSMMVRHTRADLEADAGRLREAHARYLDVARWRRELDLPPDDIFNALLLDNLSVVERRLGMFEDAESHIVEALEIYPSVHWDPRYHARAWVAKASIHVAQGEPEEAREAFARASEIYASCAGPSAFLDLRYEAAFRALSGEVEETTELVRKMFRMGVHPDFLLNENEVVTLLGPGELRRLASSERPLEPQG